MHHQDLTITVSVDQTPEEAFKAINNVRGWWSEEIEGHTDRLNEAFTYRYKDVHHCRMIPVEMVPSEKVVWYVQQNYFNFIEDQSEWSGTTVHFDISRKDGKTQIRFAHVGLVPGLACYDICSNAWGRYIRQSLVSLIATGKGQPNAKES